MTRDRTKIRKRLLALLNIYKGVLARGLLALAAFLYGYAFVSGKSAAIASAADNIELLSPNYEFVMKNVVPCYTVVAGALVLLAIFYPFGKVGTESALETIGFKNGDGVTPELVCKWPDGEHPRITIMKFRNKGIPLDEWEKRRPALETTLGVHIVNAEYGRGIQTVKLYTVSAKNVMPVYLPWKDKYLSPESFVLMLGENYLGSVSVNLADIPHILLGGSTGSGKSVLLKCIVMQSLKKGAVVAIADFKGGVDFPRVWREKCRMCYDETALLGLLDSYIDELKSRKALFYEAGQPNIDDYNRANHEHLPRCILACDEIAEVLDKTGLTKEQKDRIGLIESRLSMIARQGRAFGIHLILATQRPDANILSSQIRNNINCRVCGRADNVLSQIILDNTAAAEQIPKSAKGRFMLHDGTVFQGYWLDEGAL